MKKVYCKVSSLNDLKNLISQKQDIVCVERNLFNPNGYITCLLYTSPSPRDRG